MEKELKTLKFTVNIPNLEGDGIAEEIGIDVTAYHDPAIGEDVLTEEALELIEKTKARRMGLMPPQDIQALRKRLGLTQAEMSELLQVGEKSYTRWETGYSRPSRVINVLLCAMRDGRLDMNYLRLLKKPDQDWFGVIADEEFAKLATALKTQNSTETERRKERKENRQNRTQNERLRAIKEGAGQMTYSKQVAAATKWRINRPIKASHAALNETA